MTERLGAREFLSLVLDEGSYESWDTPPIDVAPDPAYAAELAAARAQTGLDESVLTGTGTIRGQRVALATSEFGFLAGSIGVASADRLVRAFERATAEGLPMVAAPTSGGTRMQEGAVAFLQMVKITSAVAAHRRAGLPYLVYLRHPTTGGVLASWGSLGHVTVAEPGALIGFLGPRVYQALYDEPFPSGVQLAENLYAHGLLDAVLPPADVARATADVLDVLAGPRGRDRPPPFLPLEQLPDVPAWESITRSRRKERPGVRALLAVAARPVIPLNGTGQGEATPGLILALARFGSQSCVVLGQDRGTQADQPLDAAALRTARRGMQLAAELGLPLLTVIDTAGAALSQAAEEGGLAGGIARCLYDLVTLPAPTLCLLLGQGSGGAALAMLPADRVLCAQHGWLSPLPPEGASAILYRTIDRAPEIASAQRVRSTDLLADGIVDRIVAERPDAADEPKPFLQRVGTAIEFELDGLMQRPAVQRTAARLARYRKLGVPT